MKHSVSLWKNFARIVSYAVTIVEVSIALLAVTMRVTATVGELENPGIVMVIVPSYVPAASAAAFTATFTV